MGDFIPRRYRGYTYLEVPLPLPGKMASISCPHSYPLFYEPLGLDRGHRFLEVGLGSGYGTAVAREVVGAEGLLVAIEIDPVTFRFARKNLRRAGYAASSSSEATAALAAVALMPSRHLGHPVDKTLSGGERKRIEVAAVYAMHPRLAILDEPDSGIDVLSLEDIMYLMQHMVNEGMMVLLITHRDEMIGAAHRLSLIDEGSIVATGSPSEVRAYFSRLCRLFRGSLEPQRSQDSAAERRGL